MLKIIYNETKSNVFIIYAENTKKIIEETPQPWKEWKDCQEHTLHSHSQKHLIELTNDKGRSASN